MNGQLDDTEALAADYALGTLDEAGRRAAEARLARDPAFARLVDDWNRRLVPMTQAIPPEAPPAHVWPAIQRAVRARREAGAGEAVAKAVLPLLERVAFWRWCSLATGALAAALALYIAFEPAVTPPAPEGRFVAVLNEGASTPAWVVTVDMAQKQLTIRPVAEVAVADKSLELWLIAGAEPVSLGLLEPDRGATLPVAAVLRQAAPSAAALAVSLEPLGGSPTGLPTGPVLYQGTLLPMGE